MTEISQRSDGSIRGITSGLERIRTRGSQLQTHVAQQLVVRSKDEGIGGGGGGGNGGSGGLCEAGDLARAREKAMAFRTRLQTQARIMKNSLLRGAPAAAVDSMVSRLSESLAQCESMNTKFPLFVRQMSAKQLTSINQAYNQGIRVLSEAGSQVEAHTAEYGRNAKQQQAASLIEESRRRMVGLRDHVVSLPIFRELAEDMELLANEEDDGEGGEDDMKFAASSLSLHMADLRRTHDAQTLEREVECVRMAFLSFLSASPSSASTSRSSSSSSTSASKIPKALLSQIDGEARRKELATMDPTKALHLLRHTRSALDNMDPSSDEHKKLSVIEKILSIRAHVRTLPAAAAAYSKAGPNPNERWRLRKSVVLGELARLTNAAQLLVRIEAKAREEKDGVLAKMNAALVQAKRNTSEQVSSQVASFVHHWNSQVSRTFTHFLTAILSSGSAFAESTISALEVFVSTGFLMGKDDEVGADRKVYEKSTAFDEGIGDDDEGPGEEGMGGKRAAGGGDGDLGDDDPAAEGNQGLMKKIYALCLETYDAWLQYVLCVLESNADGTGRAAGAMEKSFGPLEAQFSRMITPTTRGQD
jgi:hypothetical protein